MNSQRPHPSNGFTLLEIMVVLFLISLIVLIIAPRLSLKRSSGLHETTRKLVEEIEQLQWEAISTQRMVRLNLNLDRGLVSASVLAPSGTMTTLKGSGFREFSLSKGITIDQVRVLHEGNVHDGKTFIQFFTSGSVEPTTIRLRDERGHRMTIVIRALTGRILVVHGDYRERKVPPFFGPPSGEIPSIEDSTDEE